MPLGPSRKNTIILANGSYVPCQYFFHLVGKAYEKLLQELAGFCKARTQMWGWLKNPCFTSLSPSGFGLFFFSPPSNKVEGSTSCSCSCWSDFETKLLARSIVWDGVGVGVVWACVCVPGFFCWPAKSIGFQGGKGFLGCTQCFHIISNTPLCSPKLLCNSSVRKLVKC